MPPLAYLDPGSGSFLFQMLIGIGLGTLYTFRSSLRQFLEFFSHRKRGTPQKRGSRPSGK